MNGLVMEIEDFKSINNAKIEINKINVVGGVNGSGKSTISKILYSFLFANSRKRKDFIYQRLIEELNVLLKELEIKLNKKIFPNQFSIHDNQEEVFNKYNRLLKIAEEHISSLYETIVYEFNIIKPVLINEGMPKDDLVTDDITLLLDYILSIDGDFNPSTRNKLNNIKNLIWEYDYFNPTNNIHFNLLNLIEKLMKLLTEDGARISFEIMKELLNTEVGSYFGFKVYLADESSNNINPFSYYFQKGFINHVFYVDNVSIFDLKYSNSKIFHMDDLFNELSISPNEIVKDNNLDLILNKIEDLINGSYGKSDNSNYFTTNIYNISDMFLISEFGDVLEKSVVETSQHDTPSGIKQIGIIQLLLLNNQLKNGDYLIIDEPEVNLHPDWQFKFAEILVLLAKELNITIYLNSHSPMFIESIAAYSEYYDMQDDANYYLTEKSNNLYNFTKIPSNKLYKIYNNLGNVYDKIDELRLKKILGE